MHDSAAVAGVDATLRTVAATLHEEADELVEAMMVRIGEEAAGFDPAERPELLEGLRASCHGNIRAFLEALAGDRQPPRAPPPEALSQARASAQASVGLEAFLHTYRIGHAVVLERFMQMVEDLHLSPAQRRTITLIGSKYLFAYVDQVAGDVSAEYAAELRAQRPRGTSQRRRQMVRDILGGAELDAAELAYPLEQDHIAVIATGTDAEGTLRTIARRLDRRLLAVPMTDDTVAWLGTFRRSAVRDVRSSAWLDAAGAGHLAVGQPARGITGFRRSHEQAEAAKAVAVRLTMPVAHYDDVALEAALVGDARAARLLVEHELGRLVSAEPRAEVLRETLRCYCGCGLNAAAAAALLHVSDRTVAYRIHTIEQLLGHRVATRSAELAAAVRLHRVLTAATPTPSPAGQPFTPSSGAAR